VSDNSINYCLGNGVDPAPDTVIGPQVINAADPYWGLVNKPFPDFTTDRMDRFLSLTYGQIGGK
jgi:hypothetical protein